MYKISRLPTQNSLMSLKRSAWGYGIIFINYSKISIAFYVGVRFSRTTISRIPHNNIAQPYHIHCMHIYLSLYEYTHRFGAKKFKVFPQNSLAASEPECIYEWKHSVQTFL